MEDKISENILKLADGTRAIKLLLNAVDFNDPVNINAYLHTLRIVINDIMKELLDLDDSISAQK